MAEITDERMREWMRSAAPYTLLVLRRAAGYATAANRDAIIWEHGRRNMSLQAEGILPIVCPIRDDSELAGIGIFAADPDKVAAIMEGDPGVQAGVFSYETHPCHSIPGVALPPR